MEDRPRRVRRLVNNSYYRWREEDFSQGRKFAIAGLHMALAYRQMEFDPKQDPPTLYAFRAMMNRKGIRFSPEARGEYVLRIYDSRIYKRVAKEAVKRGTDPHIFAAKLFNIICRDDMFNAILDDDNEDTNHDRKRPDNPKAPTDPSV
jgi:hypothetical protein